MAPIDNIISSTYTRKQRFKKIATISGITGGVILATGLGVGLTLRLTTEDKESTQYNVGTGILTGGSILGAGAIVTSIAFLSLSQSNKPVTILDGFQDNVINDFVFEAVGAISSGLESKVERNKREDADRIKRDEAGKIQSGAVRINPDAALSKLETGAESQMRIKIQPGSEYMAMQYREEIEPFQQTSM